MEKKKFLLSKKIAVLFLIISIFCFQSSFSQCTNPEPTGNPSQSFCKTDNSTVADLVATGGTIVWFDAPAGGNQYTNSTSLFSGITYYADDIDGGNCSTNRLAVTVSIYGNIPTNVDVFVGKCASENPTIADLAATGSNIAWYDAQTGGTLLAFTDPLVNGQTYWVQQTENGCTSDRLPTTVNLVNPTAPTAPPTQSFCYPPNPTISDLQATGTVITWYATETSTTPLNPTTPLVDGEDYWAAESSFPCESTVRSQTTVSLDAAPNAGTDGSYLECELNLASTNLFELLGGMPNSTGTWSGPSVLTNGYLGTFEPGINIEGVYTYTVSSALGICPDDSANVTVKITVVPPPTLTNINTNQTFCEIDNATVADLSIVGTNIQWYDTNNSTIPLNPTDVLANGDYWATQTDASGCESATRLAVNVSIITTPPPTTTESNQTFCEIDGATVTDLSASGDGILWYDTETSATPLSSSDALLDGEDYWATQTDATSGCESASRLVVTVSIISTPPPTTTEPNQTFCEIDGATVANLSASGNGIVWYDTETSTTPLSSSDTLMDGEDYWATQTDATSGCESAGRLTVTVSIISTLPPTTTEPNQTFCIKDYLPDTPTIADLNISGSAILWYDTETSTSPLNSSDILIDGEDYWATQTEASSSCESATRLVINVSIINPPTPTTSQINQSFCVADNPTIANLQVSGNGILWYDTVTSTTPLNDTDLLVDSEDYWASASETSTGCESISRVMVTASISDVSPATITNTSQSFCASDYPTITDLQATGNGIIWYSSETETTALNPTDLLVNNEDYWAVQTDPTTGCVSSVRVAANVSLTDAGTPTITTHGNEFCVIDNPTVSNLNANVSAVNGGTITWFDSYPNGSTISLSEFLTEGETYYAVETDSDGCSSTTPLAVTVSLDACDQYDVETYDGFSPTGNGTNDTFKIGNLRELYPNFKVEFYNRWGNLVYTANASKPDWNGRLRGNGELVPSGVYYFIIFFNKDDRKPIQRRLYLSR